MEFALKFLKILKELLSGALKGKDIGDQLGLLEDALRSSFMLSFLVSIVVVVASIHKVLGPIVALKNGCTACYDVNLHKFAQSEHIIYIIRTK